MLLISIGDWPGATATAEDWISGTAYDGGDGGLASSSALSDSQKLAFSDSAKASESYLVPSETFASLV